MGKQNSNKGWGHRTYLFKSFDENVKIHIFPIPTLFRSVYGIKSIHFSKQMRCVIHFTPLTPFVAILQLNPCYQEKYLMRTLNCKVFQLTVMGSLNQRS